jgi:hypothetical protein
MAGGVPRGIEASASIDVATRSMVADADGGLAWSAQQRRGLEVPLEFEVRRLSCDGASAVDGWRCSS